MTLIELLVVIAIIGMLIALLLPAVQSAREAARRMQCTNNLKQMGLAVHLYHDQHGSLPPQAHGVPSQGIPHAWASLVLPFLERQSLYDQFDFDREIIDEVNHEPLRAVVDTFVCPSTVRQSRDHPTGNPLVIQDLSDNNLRNISFAVHDYHPTVWIFYTGRVSEDNLHARGAWMGGKASVMSKVRFVDIEDGLSNTTLFMERCGLPDQYTDHGTTVTRHEENNFGIPAAWAVYWRRDSVWIEDGKVINHANTEGIYSFHPGGANVVMCDGAVHFLREGMDWQTFYALVSREGGEAINAKDLQ